MIPKIIHYCWVGNKPLPPLAKKCIASWHRVMPDYEVKFWNESNYNFRKNAFMNNAYKNKKWAFVTDYARLDIVYNYGGIYLDTDVETLKPFDEFLKYPAFCGFENQYFVNFGHGFGAEKGNKVILNIMAFYENINSEVDKAISKQAVIYGKKQGENWQKKNFNVPSPVIQTQCLIKKYGLKQDNNQQHLEDMEVFPSFYFSPKNEVNLPTVTKEAYSVHWYAGSWLPQQYKIYTSLKILAYKIFGKGYTYIYKIKRKLFK